MPDPQLEISIWLEGLGEPLDVTSNHVVACASPFTIGIGLNGGGTPHSDELKLTERVTRVSANLIDYAATLDDPKPWAKPWKVAFPLRRDSGSL